MPPSAIKLLLVEDSPEDAELILATLSSAGLAIESVLVYDHVAARGALQATSIDVIVCDYLLPGSSGEEVLKTSLEVAPGTPFIFLSGMFGEQVAVDMMKLGALDYLLKQNMKMLPKAVERAVLEVTERRKRIAAESALEISEVRARLAMDAAELGVWDVDPRTGAVFWDDRCRSLYQVTSNTELNLSEIYKLCHPDDKEGLRIKVGQALHQPTTFTAEYRITIPDGQERWLLSHGRSIFTDGKCSRFSGVLQDVTERTRATQKLIQLTEALGAEVEQTTRERDRTWELSREMLGVFRFDMTPISFNPAWELTLGWSKGKIGHLQLWELIHPDDVEATDKETQRVAQGNVSTRFVNRMRHADGDWRWLSWTIVPDDGLMYAAVRDITEERSVVEQLARINADLREQIQERQKVEAALQQMQRLEVVGQLTAGVAHDFNNLLTVILASTTFAIRDIERGTLQRTIKRLLNVKEAGERGAKLTAQLLSFSRRQRLQPSPINLNETLAGMQDLLIRALGGGIWVETDLAPDLWNALVDPTQMEMIILNLAINARDAMSMGGALRISTRNDVVVSKPRRAEDPDPGDYVVLSIRDAGTGMTPEVLARVFEPFFTTKEVGKGSGLGLAQAFGFAKQSGGGVRISTVIGEGTDVQVYLPRVDLAPFACADMEDGIPIEEPNKLHTVLLVEDDTSVRSVTATILEALGYEVIEAGEGLEALHHLSDKIDLILTDFAMPGMTGAELALKAAESFPKIPIVYMTGYADINALGLADASVIQKPFREKDIKLVLEAALYN
jgi:PAS domain S-box-containing protein